MRFTDISIIKSAAHQHAWVLSIEINECRFTGYFNDFGGFITAVTEAAKFFAVRAGKLRVKDANLTRVVVPGDGRANVLPGDKLQ
ncbi:hypothetical protein FP568_13320 [Pandoraea pnomenusa]|uniref:hypothetical protein n=1 Tax=Pandoraea pnomenusa TaxID=93220 RepID=UPI001198B0D0|nr:hypothetical protein [Pandoraea pnomenusa]QDX22141.1 hypothetical protein FP568_13320 [Pandoraea pnomenusa]